MISVNKNAVPVLGVLMYNKDIPSAVAECTSACLTGPGENKCISATGAHGLVHAQKNPEFFKTLQSFAVNLPDGMPTVWVGRLKGAKKMKRCYGPDFFKSFIIHSASYPIRHFFCGGKEGVADELAETCRKKFNNPNICGTFCPPFRSLSENEFMQLGQQINASGANVVWIGLSTPKQETFAKLLSQYTDVQFLVTVGAAFDFHTGKVRQAPPFLQRIGLEWLFRLIKEPRRLYRRYLEIVPLFLYYNLKEFLFSESLD
jgi:N-acetylglucosaminyldiphosphoundecaprenol N-acetyl-beta-D-mannosaminyltransferase